MQERRTPDSNLCCGFGTDSPSLSADLRPARGLAVAQTSIGAVLDVVLDRTEVDQAASEFVSGSILSGQSAGVSSHQLHSERKCKLS